MNAQRAQELAAQFKAQNDQYIAFVDACDDATWQANVPGEDWTVGSVFHHIAAGHYASTGLMKRAVRGQEVPVFGSEFIEQRNAEQAAQHASYKRDEVAEMLRVNGAKIHTFIGGLSDEQLDTEFRFGLFDKGIAVGKLFKIVILRSCYEHYEHVLAATSS